MNSLVNSCDSLCSSVLGLLGARNSTTGMLSHVLSNITDTSYLIGDWTGRVALQAAAKYFVFESDRV